MFRMPHADQAFGARETLALEMDFRLVPEFKPVLLQRLGQRNARLARAALLQSQMLGKPAQRVGTEWRLHYRRRAQSLPIGRDPDLSNRANLFVAAAARRAHELQPAKLATGERSDNGGASVSPDCNVQKHQSGLSKRKGCQCGLRVGKLLDCKSEFGRLTAQPLLDGRVRTDNEACRTRLRRLVVPGKPCPQRIQH